MPTVAVVGATGTQGSGVVSALLSDPSFKVRGITTNLNSTRAQALLSKYADKVKEERFSLVVGNLDDESTLKEALEGCDKLFAAFGPGPTPRDGETAEEVQQGKNLVDAAKAAGIDHFVYSSLKSMKEETKGQYTQVHHHESKAAVEEYAKEHLECVTSVLPAAFYTNLNSRGWVRRDGDTVVFCAPFSENVRLAWTAADFDVGNYTLAIFKKGPEATRGKSYLCTASTTQSIAEIAADYHKITGEKVSVEPLSIEEGSRLTAEDMKADASLAKELQDAFSWFNQAYANMPADALKYPTGQVFEELGVSASTFRQYLERTGWRVKTN